MIARLEEIENKYNKLKEELLKPEVLEDYNKVKTLSKKLVSMKRLLIFL